MHSRGGHGMFPCGSVRCGAGRVRANFSFGYQAILLLRPSGPRSYRSDSRASSSRVGARGRITTSAGCPTWWGSACWVRGVPAAGRAELLSVALQPPRSHPKAHASETHVRLFRIRRSSADTTRQWRIAEPRSDPGPFPSGWAQWVRPSLRPLQAATVSFDLRAAACFRRRQNSSGHPSNRLRGCSPSGR
jgi:hypothetical protein